MKYVCVQRHIWQKMHDLTRTSERKILIPSLSSQTLILKFFPLLLYYYNNTIMQRSTAHAPLF